MTTFDLDVFEAVVDNIIIGGYDEDGNIAPYNMIFVLKCGEKHLVTGRKYQPQRKNAVARLFPEEFKGRDYIEVCSFRYYIQHFEFAREADGMKKILRDGVNVSVVIPIERKTEKVEELPEQKAA